MQEMVYLKAIQKSAPMGVSVSGTTDQKRIWKNLGGASAPLAPSDPPMSYIGLNNSETHLLWVSGIHGTNKPNYWRKSGFLFILCVFSAFGRADVLHNLVKAFHMQSKPVLKR